MHYKRGVTPLQYFNYNIRRADSGCLEWTGHKNRLGYGVYTFGWKRTAAHRFSYSTFVGDIPAGLQVRHSCNNPSCVDPSHLKIGTHLDNMSDRKSSGNYDVGAGRKVPEHIVREIYNSKGSEPELARKYGFNRTIINCIRTGKTYKNITGGGISPNHRFSRQENIYAARQFTVTGPNGERFTVENLSRWVRDNIHLFSAPNTKTPLHEKVRSGLASSSGYNGWKAKIFSET